jgi:dolichol-phosphate mannosyltransferase
MIEPELSVVVPVYDEAENVADLIAEIEAALAGIEFEMVFVDDASRDSTLDALRQCQVRHPRLRVLRHATNAGQSTALYHGILAARAPWVVTLDGDGQNDPNDIRRLLAERDALAPNTKLFAGWRHQRQDSWLKRQSSLIANAVRGTLLGDQTPDTGCGLKLIEREVFLRLPYFSHMHRFLPALVRRAGYEVLSVPVGHRPRTRGQSKYGVWNRLWVGLVDLFGVAWLQRRTRHTAVSEIPAPEHPGERPS